jgi:hypothetical protein
MPMHVDARLSMTPPSACFVSDDPFIKAFIG